MKMLWSINKRQVVERLYGTTQYLEVSFISLLFFIIFFSFPRSWSSSPCPFSKDIAASHFAFDLEVHVDYEMNFLEHKMTRRKSFSLKKFLTNNDNFLPQTVNLKFQFRPITKHRWQMNFPKVQWTNNFKLLFNISSNIKCRLKIHINLIPFCFAKHFSRLHFFSFFIGIMKSKRCKNCLDTTLQCKTNKHKHTFFFFASCYGCWMEEKLQQKFVVEKLSISFQRTARAERLLTFLPFFFIFFGLLCTTFCVYKLWGKTTRHYKNECCGLR